MQPPDFLQPDLRDDFCLNTVFEIENVMLHIKEINQKVEHLKGLKKHRIQVIDQEVGELEGDVKRFRGMVLRTMQQLQPNQKTLNFPDVGKVSRRSVKAGCEIYKSDEMVEFFTKEGKKEEVIKVKESIDTRAAKKLIDFYTQAGVDVPGTKIIPPSESISITFEEPKDTTAAPVELTAPAEKQSIDALDTLDL